MAIGLNGTFKNFLEAEWFIDCHGAIKDTWNGLLNAEERNTSVEVKFFKIEFFLN